MTIHAGPRLAEGGISTEQHAHIDWVLLGSGESITRCRISGSLYLQLVYIRTNSSSRESV